MVEPIAVVGLDAKLPCDGDTPEKFFELLVAGRSAKTPVPADRYNAEAFWHPNMGRAGVIVGKEAHFMKTNVKAFDAPFFAMTPTEAANLDPQQRLLLECAYTAMENAGYSMANMQGSRTGVYAGAFLWDYRDLLVKDVDVPMTYTACGTIPSTLAGRVSWFYDLRGPAMSIDTACSSSMVALHQAVLGLKTGDCDMALACGTNLIITPETGLQLNGLGVLAPGGQSLSFDSSANGYGRGEGIGAVVLKRLSDAVRDGDTIRAVIRNSGCNHDGHTPGLTAPGKEAQAELMRDTYAQAGLDPSQTRFFEAHGTGTNVGDPTEASAISEMFTPYRSAEEPLYIGALKSNIGHTEGNSGIASFIKAVLCLESGIITANAGFKRKHAKILDEWHMAFPTKAIPWPKTSSGVRRVSINSFGISGTNAHVIMDDAYSFLKEFGHSAPHRSVETGRLLTQESAAVINGTPFSPQLFVLSSNDQDGISRLCKAYKEYIPSMREPLYNLSYTLAQKRSKFSWRAAAVASSGVELERILGQKQDAVRAVTDSGAGYIFTGQGAQWPKMGLDLMQYAPFRESLERADVYLKTIGCKWSVIGELSKEADGSRVNNAEFSQLLCTALQVALVDLVANWGIKPQSVVGHSSGEIAAAYCAGALSEEDAWRIGYWRGKLSAELSQSQPRVGMAAVGLDVGKAQEYIDKLNKVGDEKLTVACMNSKTSQTISGGLAKIDSLVETLTEAKIFARKLKIEMAYHSNYMEPIAREYASRIGEIRTGRSSEDSDVRFYSSTYGSRIGQAKLREAAYWVKNLVSPVRFLESASAMLQEQDESNDRHLITDIVEIGPHAALQGPLRNIVDDVRGVNEVKYHSLLTRSQSDVTSIMSGVGSMFSRGIEIDLAKVNHIDLVRPSMMIDLPRYPFNHTKEYLNESRLSRNFRFRPYPRHELLGSAVNDWDGKHDAVWRNWIRFSENPWIEHHTVSGTVLYPAAGMLVMAIEGCRQLSERSLPGKPIKGIRFREVSFHSALQVPANNGVESHLYLRPLKQAALETGAPTWREFSVCTAQENDEWREHCCGQVLVEYDEPVSIVDGGLEEEKFKAYCAARIDDAQQKCKTRVSSTSIYDTWQKNGLFFGPTFQTVTDPRVDHESGITLAKVKPTVEYLKTLMPYQYLQPHLIHPTTLDGALQVCLVPLISNPAREQKDAIVLSFIEELWVSASEHPTDCYEVVADSIRQGRKKSLMSCVAVDSKTKEPMMKVAGCIVTDIEGADTLSSAALDLKKKAWHIDWKSDVEFISRMAAGSFEKFIEALTHKSPSMKLLDVSNGETESTSAVLSALKQRFSRYDLIIKSQDSSEKARKLFSAELGTFTVSDFANDLTTQGFDAKTYDGVFVQVNTPADLDEVLRKTLGLLKTSGKLILTFPQSQVGLPDWEQSLLQNGLSEPLAKFAHANYAYLVCNISTPGNGASSDPCSYIIVADLESAAQTQLAEKVATSLGSKDAKAQTVKLSQLPEVDEGVVAKSTVIVLTDLYKSLLASVDETAWAGLKVITKGKRILWVTNEARPDNSLVTGFAGSIRHEKPGLEFVVVTFTSEEKDELVADIVSDIDEQLSRSEGPIETSYKVVNGSIKIPRLVEAVDVTLHVNQTIDDNVTKQPFGSDPSRPIRLQIRNIGLLDSLCFTEDNTYPIPLEEDEVEFKPAATAINFKDLAIMLGKVPETPVGLESAGIVTRVGRKVTKFKAGDRVFGFSPKGAFGTYGRGSEGRMARIPDNVSFMEAATLPIVYTTAYGCLYDIGDLNRRAARGQKPTILIHAAAGGVGQAAIQMAQREGAEIFATVGSIEKTEFLEKTYGIRRDHIFSSRDLTFKQGVLRMTGGRGVDIVINSLSGDMLRATWDIVASFGAFAEIGLGDINARSRISMGTFARGVRFEALDLNYMRDTGSGKLDDVFGRTMHNILEEHPLNRAMPIKNYPVSKIEDAMRFIQSGKHIGKLVIEFDANDMVPLVRQPKPATSFDADSTYVVVGGFGGLGLEIVQWFANHGARNLLVTSRRGPVDEKAKAVLADLQNSGVRVAGPLCDITNKAGLEKALTSALSDMPPVRGCVQAAATLNDSAFAEMTLDQWYKTVNIKSTGTMNLWQLLTKNEKLKLDFFVMFSSLIGMAGNYGQANYGAGNSYLDGLAHSLTSKGHNAIAINIPVMLDAGMVATRTPLKEYLLSVGWAAMTSKELLNTLDYYCRPNSAKSSSSVNGAQIIPRLWLPKYSVREGAEELPWQNEPKYSHMEIASIQEGISSGDNNDSGKRSISELLVAADGPQEAQQVVQDALLEQLAKVLSCDLADLDPTRALTSYGVDSLVAVELRIWIIKEIGADVSVFELTGGQRIDQIAKKAAKTSRFSRTE